MSDIEKVKNLEREYYKLRKVACEIYGRISAYMCYGNIEGIRLNKNYEESKKLLNILGKCFNIG